MTITKARNRIAKRRWLKRTLLVFALLVVVAIGPYLVSRFRSAGRQVRVHSDAPVAANAEQVRELRVLIYNIAHGRGPTGGNWDGPAADDRKRIAQIAQMIRRESPDIVILNEADFCSTWSGHQNQARAIADLAGYAHFVEQRNFDLRFIYGSWKFGNAVLSRFPIVDAQPINYPTRSYWENTFAGSKQGVVCTLQLSATQRLQVLPVHLEYRDEPTRIGSAEVIVETAEVSETPTLAAGDFNSSLSSSLAAENRGAQATAIDLLYESGVFHFPSSEVPSQLTPGPTFPATEPDLEIDWILAPAGWKFTEYRVLDEVLSDHRPVVATIHIDDRHSETP